MKSDRLTVVIIFIKKVDRLVVGCALTQLQSAYMDAILTEHQFQLTLDQSLILAMEDEARWMINNKRTAETQTPDFLEYLDTEGLEAVNPNAVNIIR